MVLYNARTRTHTLVYTTQDELKATNGGYRFLCIYGGL
jgi:hypothetical protein